ncbi:hypothetical protein A5792_19985 [Mycolicibacterium peregrinum]|uniref:Uncharacterized protein n=1 Tax=Mycolicibacterium peregrinum TaxID=43304 RepID=A0A1A0R4L0_MYCPR|nr:hypothetical protein A5792_19985 [Mycolicibacterium peregrinum]
MTGAGDSVLHIPWNNLGFFQDTGSLGFSEQLVRIGTTDDVDAIRRLGCQDVTITLARCLAEPCCPVASPSGVLLR